MSDEAMVGALRETQVQTQLGRCCIGLDKLECAVKDLEKRLDGVLTPPPPQCSNDKKEPVIALVMFANNLKSIADRITFTVNQINELKNRIEL